MKTIAPAQAGISAKMLELAGQRLAEAVAAGQLTAASLVVARHGSLVFAQGYGCLSPDPASPAVQPDSVFLLASITKPVTAGALMRLVDRGQISSTIR